MTLNELMGDYGKIITMKGVNIPGSPVYFSVKFELDRMHAFSVWSWNAKTIQVAEPNKQLNSLISKVDVMLKRDLVRLTSVYLKLIERAYA
jgi:hypothetical protein